MWTQMRRAKVAALSILSLGALSSLASLASAEGRDISQYNLENGVGLKGYTEKARFGFDPVSAFPEGGGAILQGEPQIMTQFGGVTYFFASQEHLQMFLRNPSKYEPTYGGWCAYAMASGEKIEIEARHFTIHGNRAHYFVSARAKRNFDRDIAGFEANADANWKRISNEDPRL